jgi:cyclopropane fatty-acyl-phospholipid synthase-like methyltransferase
MTKSQKFWNKFAARYAARPLKNVPAYEAMLADVAARLKPTDKVLEIGCGTGGTAIRLAPAVAQWTATDFSIEMVKIAQAKPAGGNVTFKVADASNTFDGGPFDAICAFNVLHLVDDLPQVLAQIHANLKPGGQLISKTWCFADMRLSLRVLFRILRAFGLFPAATMHSAVQLRAAILNSGLEIIDERVFGEHQQNPYIVARKPA